ncbi:MAG TPA: hypothetical protein VH331_14735 [Allosphingosinicella sp.]|jgi:hypothetical protein|nr:hypothetical protein [Allosphingosinicella sp.]
MWSRENFDDDWLPCARPPYSFYNDFIEAYWEGGASEQTAACIHRICTLARKMEACSFLMEDVSARPDVAAEIDHLQSFSPGVQGLVSARAITFLTSRRPRAPQKSVPKEDGVIGHLVIISFPVRDGRRSYLYEAIIRVPGKRNVQLLNNNLTTACRLSFRAWGTEMRIPASYFCQQNGVTSICAHSAVRGLIRTKTGRSVSTAELNEFWGFESPADAVDSREVIRALRHNKLDAVPYHVDGRKLSLGQATKNDTIWSLLAGLADSGAPALLMLGGEGQVDHVISVLGHTFNSDEWHPLGTALHVNGHSHFASSSLWIDHLVIHDDLLGPYYCLSRAGLFQEDPAAPRPRHVIALLPSGASVSPTLAEDAGRQLLEQLIKAVKVQGLGKGRWWDMLTQRRERWLFRATLIDRESWCDGVERQAPESRVGQRLARKLLATLPPQVWMCELSLPNLFLANSAKLGEILINPNEFDVDDPLAAILAFRLPSLIGWPDPKRKGTFVANAWPERGLTLIHAPYRHQNWW